MKIGLLDVVLLKDGREATIVMVFDDSAFEAEVGTGPEDWHCITVKRDMIDRVLYHYDSSEKGGRR